MVQDRPIPASMLDEVLIAVRNATDEELRYGDLTTSSELLVATFYAHIKELRDKTKDSAGRKQNTKVVEITARAQDVEDLMIDDELRIQGVDIKYQVNSIYESDWKYGTTIVAQYKQ